MTPSKPDFLTEQKSDLKSVSLYGGAVVLDFDEEKHLYTVDGVPVDGVTSVLGVINKPALTYWAANMGAMFLDENLIVGEVTDEIRKKFLVEGVKKAHRTRLSVAADYGTILHGLIEDFIKGKEPKEPTNPTLKKAFGQFKEWVVKNKVEFKTSERKIYSKKYNYAGTLDFTAKIGGKNVIGDIKTSSGIWSEYWLQTSAYKEALMEEFPDTPIDHCVIIRCGKDGSFEVKEQNDFEKNIEAFVGALALHRRLKEMDYQTRQSTAK